MHAIMFLDFNGHVIVWLIELVTEYSIHLYMQVCHHFTWDIAK